ncbi:MAG: hypothetical protein JKY67_08195, partial [Pseudomonadales bacterium]|nr:hypothetical protein [Pseudomonadales bacterium]
GGTSVPWFDRDAIRGVVIARQGDSLTVRGRHWDRENRSGSFNDDIQVTLADSTRVTKQGVDNEGASKDSISVGQRLIAFGQMSGEVSGEFLLDTSHGHIRMMMNLIKGVVVSAEPLALDVRWINGRRPDLFDFSGTGAENTSDADSDYYEIDTGSLVLENIEMDDLLKARGFMTPFGSAPEDYEAQTIIEINIEQRAGVLNVRWPGGSSEPFVSVEDELIVLNMDDATYRLSLAGIPASLALELENISLAPLGANTDELNQRGKGMYSIKERDGAAIQVYTRFSAFVEGLNSRLSEGKVLIGLLSDGRMNSDTGVMYAVNINALFSAE